MAEVLKTNNMARKQGSGFKMKSSPMLGKKEDKRKFDTYNKARASVTGDMTDQQLREIAVNQHLKKGKPTANRWNVSYDELVKLRGAKINAAKDKQSVVNKEEIKPKQDVKKKESIDEVKIESPKETQHYGVEPSHNDATWYERQSGDPTEKGEFSNVNLDKTVNIKRSDLSNPEIMKIKNRNRQAAGMDIVNPILKKSSGFKMPGFGKRKK